MKIEYLKIAGLLSFIAALLHVAVIIGGPNWYRFFGAGEGMAQMAEQGLLTPILITTAISLVLFIWALYAWSAAGMIIALPFLKLVLIAITSIYLVRGVLGLVAPFVSEHPQIAQNSTSFWVWSSMICLLIGLVHGKGLMDKWSTL